MVNINDIINKLETFEKDLSKELLGLTIKAEIINKMAQKIKHNNEPFIITSINAMNLSNDFTKHIIEIKNQYNDSILLGIDIYCLPIYMAVKDEFKIDTSFSDGALIFTLRYTLDNSVIMSYGSGYNVR